MLSNKLLWIIINFIIVLVTIIAFFQIFNNKPTFLENTLPDLETIFCRNPQSYSKSDLLFCTSATQFFLTLKEDCVRKQHVSSVKVEDISGNDSVEALNEVSEVVKEDSEVVDKEDKSMSFVDLLVVILLVVSAVISMIELYKEMLRRQNQAAANGGTPGDGKVGDRRMSLVDLTVSRHARKRESQQLDNFRTNNNTPNVRGPPPLIRRMSFPAQLPEAITVRGRHAAPTRQQSLCSSQHSVTAGRKMSVDLSEDDSSPDRRRIRLLRRH